MQHNTNAAAPIDAAAAAEATPRLEALGLDQIICELLDYRKFLGETACKTTPLLHFPSYFDAAKALLEQHREQLSAAQLSIVHTALARSLRIGECFVSADGREMSQRDLTLRAIELDTSNAIAYSNLGFLLSPYERIQLFNGRTMTKRSLYLKAIDIDPYYEHAYYNLANSLHKDEQVQLLDRSSSLTKQGLYRKSIELDPTCASFYNNLAISLNGKPDEIIELADGSLVCQRDLFLLAQYHDPSHISSKHNLTRKLCDFQQMLLPCGTTVERTPL